MWRLRFRYETIASVLLSINGLILMYLVLPVLTYLAQKGMSVEAYFAWRDALIYFILSLLHFAVAYGLIEGSKEAFVAAIAISIMGFIFFISLFPLQLFYLFSAISLIMGMVKGKRPKTFPSQGGSKEG